MQGWPVFFNSRVEDHPSGDLTEAGFANPHFWMLSSKQVYIVLTAIKIVCLHAVMLWLTSMICEYTSVTIFEWISRLIIPSSVTKGDIHSAPHPRARYLQNSLTSAKANACQQQCSARRWRQEYELRVQNQNNSVNKKGRQKKKNRRGRPSLWATVALLQLSEVSKHLFTGLRAPWDCSLWSHRVVYPTPPYMISQHRSWCDSRSLEVWKIDNISGFLHFWHAFFSF